MRFRSVAIPGWPRGSWPAFVYALATAGCAAVSQAQSPGIFAATGNMATPRVFHTATLLPSGKVLIAGGSVSSNALTATAELYDPDTGTFSATGSMTAPRMAHTATLLADGRVLIAGGTITAGQGFIPSNSAEIYDPSTGTFAATGDMIANHVCQQASLLGTGKVLIVSGSGGSGDVPNAELYDPATGAFASTGTYASGNLGFNTCQGAVSSLLPDGRVLILWEENGAELYDPNTGVFSLTSGPIDQSYNDGLPTATLLTNGNVLFAGGEDDWGIHTDAQLYDPSTGAFALTADLTAPRDLNSATLLPDGSVLMAGTFLGGGVALLSGGSFASAELYDPVKAAFTPTGGMTVPRCCHTATLLNNGRVLIAGGNPYISPMIVIDGSPTFVAELYTPAVLTPAPALFSLSGGGQGQGAIWHSTTGLIASSDNPAVAGEALSMYTTSLAEGGVIPPQVAVGGRLAEILYFGDAPGYPGYNQVNFRAPGGVTSGPAVTVRLTYLNRPSNTVTIGVQ